MSEDRKTEILQAFMKLVSRFGLEKTTIQDIAKDAGVSVGVIYKDYANKDELIDAYANLVVEKIIDDYRDLIDENKSPEEQLYDLIIGSVKIIHHYLLDDLGIQQILADDISLKYVRKNYSRKAEIKKCFVSLVNDIMQDGVEQGVFQIKDVPLTAELFLDAFQGYYMSILFEENYVDQLLEKREAMFRFLIKNLKR
ncbi:MAG: TetR/AcrR family transcriptional regulator [Firmicutes bacterium]|nr:TetR/AcrR family transcriptional regulator [Bacillota bacterium]